MTGTIKSLQQNFGFIKCAEDQVDYFFLPGALNQFGPKYAELKATDRVEFDGVPNYVDPRSGKARGPRALSVSVLQAQVAYASS